MAEEQAGAKPAQQQQRAADIRPFIVEFGDNHCRNFTITTPPLNRHVRGAFDVTRLGQRIDMGSVDGRKTGQPDMSSTARRIPSIPGIHLEIRPRERKARLYDPLAEEPGKQVLEEYNLLAEHNREKLRGPYAAEQPVTKDLDDDQLKTLLFELLRKNESGSIRVIKGELPTREQIESLAGYELNDPGNKGSGKPRYKKDLPEWERRMQAAGVI